MIDIEWRGWVGRCQRHWKKSRDRHKISKCILCVIPMQSSVCSWADDENCAKNRTTKISWVSRHVSERGRHFSFHSIMKTITANELVRWTAIIAWKSPRKKFPGWFKTEMNFLTLPRRRVQSGAEKDIMQKILILFVLCVISKSKGKLDFFFQLEVRAHSAVVRKNTKLNNGNGSEKF